MGANSANFLSDPRGRHLISCARCLHTNLNISLLAFAMVTLYIAVTAYADFNPELMLYFKYEPINVLVITGWACALVIAAFVGIYSSIALSADGYGSNAIILVLLIASATSYTAWRTATHDYSKTSDLFKQLDDQMDRYGSNQALIDKMQRTLSCCGFEGFQDWVRAIPLSCCPGVEDKPNPVCNADSPLLNNNGCFVRLTRMLSYYNWIIFITIILLNSVQTVVVSLSYILFRTVRWIRQKDTLEAPEPKSEPEPEAEPEPEPEPVAETAAEPTPEPEAAPESQTETNIPPPPPLPEAAKNFLVVNFA